MADQVKIRLNSKEIRAFLSKDPAIRQMVDGGAAALANAVTGDAEIDDYTTDRAAAGVRVAAEDQAKSGALTKAAASIGLEVKVK